MGVFKVVQSTIFSCLFKASESWQHEINHINSPSFISTNNANTVELSRQGTLTPKEQIGNAFKDEPNLEYASKTNAKLNRSKTNKGGETEVKITEEGREGDSDYLMTPFIQKGYASR